ncbi:MAG: L,D-transpeptidase [Patescibacteria group bacterium]
MLVALAGGFGAAASAHAATPVSALYEANGKIIRQLKNIPQGASIAVADLGLDGVSELIIGSPAGQKPSVRVLRLDGSVIRTIALGNVHGTPAVHVAVGDVTGDGIPEIITSFGKGTTPEVRVHTATGRRTNAFLAFGKGFRGGVNLTVADADANGVADIITGAGPGGGPFVVAFTGQGKKLHQFLAYAATERGGVRVFAGDTNGDGTVEIVTATRTKNSPVKVFGTNGVVASSFAIKKIQTASVHIAAQLSGAILLGTAASTGSQVTSYTETGTVTDIHFYPFGKQYSGEVNAVALNADADDALEVIVVANPAEVPAGEKRIVVDISDQRMYRYIGNTLVATHVVSTGKWSMPTPLGNHQVKNKITTAYSRKYALYMDNWMAITPDGAYGIHSLPYWRLKNGGIYYEGVNHLGRRVSHGCIRLSPAESKQVFAWTAVGTKVQVVD